MGGLVGEDETARVYGRKLSLAICQLHQSLALSPQPSLAALNFQDGLNRLINVQWRPWIQNYNTTSWNINPIVLFQDCVDFDSVLLTPGI